MFFMLSVFCGEADSCITSKGDKMGTIYSFDWYKLRCDRGGFADILHACRGTGYPKIARRLSIKDV